MYEPTFSDKEKQTVAIGFILMLLAFAAGEWFITFLNWVKETK